MSGLGHGIPGWMEVIFGSSDLPQSSEVEATDPETRFFGLLPESVSQGWNPWGVYTHAHLECRMRPIGQNNFFGVIARAEIPLVVKAVKTSEEVNHVETPAVRDFGDWPTLKEAMGWYWKHVREQYPTAFEHRDNPIVYFNYLGPWATEHDYVIRLTNRYKELRLNPGLSERLRVLQGGV